MDFNLSFIVYFVLVFTLLLVTLALIEADSPDWEAEQERLEHEEYLALLESNAVDRSIEADAIFYRALSMRIEQRQSFTAQTLWPHHYYIPEGKLCSGNWKLSLYVYRKEESEDKKVLTEFLRHARPRDCR